MEQIFYLSPFLLSSPWVLLIFGYFFLFSFSSIRSIVFLSSCTNCLSSSSSSFLSMNTYCEWFVVWIICRFAWWSFLLKEYNLDERIPFNTFRFVFSIRAWTLGYLCSKWVLYRERVVYYLGIELMNGGFWSKDVWNSEILYRKRIDQQ